MYGHQCILSSKFQSLITLGSIYLLSQRVSFQVTLSFHRTKYTEMTVSREMTLFVTVEKWTLSFFKMLKMSKLLKFDLERAGSKSARYREVLDLEKCSILPVLKGKVLDKVKCSIGISAKSCSALNHVATFLDIFCTLNYVRISTSDL